MCTINGCDRKPVAKGLCAMHYMRARRTGDPNHTRKPGHKRDPLPMWTSQDQSPRLYADWPQTAADAHGTTEQAVDAATSTREPAEHPIQIGMMKRTLLLLDDDPLICEVFCEGLADDFVVTVTDDVDDAYRLAVKTPPDVLLLDMRLRTGNGIELCQRLRDNPLTRKIPIVIMTGYGNADNMIASYEVGADDFIEKPVNLRVIRTRLLARVQRVQDLTNSGALFGNLKLYPERLEVEIGEKIFQLSETEFDLLRVFLANPNRKISREEILKTVWKGVQVTKRAVDVHISQLRQKLTGFNHSIKTLYGRGYILRPLT
jgi:two-component system, OmpR family, phosphate regulon response regulator PhoB